LVVNFMQNSVVATPPDRSNSPARKPAAAHDFSLDPLPVPDATESNTDTAWGLWEHTLKSMDEPDVPTQPAELQDFPDTEMSDLLPPLTPPAPKKP
jgi:hypothetical protein